MKTVKHQKRTPHRRRDILNASLHCFMRHGVDAATIEQIREESGASSGSIYHHFGSKQAIAVALYVEGMAELESVLRNAMNKHSTLREGIRDIIESYLRWVSENRDWALYLLRVATADLSSGDAATIDDINRKARQDLTNWLRPFREREEVVHLPDELYSSLIYGASTHFARHWLVGRLTLDLRTASRHLSDVAYQSLARQLTENADSRAKPGSRSTGQARSSRLKKESAK